MFTDEWCEDWDSTKNQDNFMKEYFHKKGVDSKLKTSHGKADQQKSGYRSTSSHLLQNKHSLNDQLECNKKRKKQKMQLCYSSQEYSTEIDSQNIEMIQSPKYDSSNSKKKKMFSHKNASNESSEQIKNAEAEIVIENFSSNSIKETDLCNNEIGFDSRKLKKKRKQLKNRKDNIQEATISVCSGSENVGDVTFNNSSVRYSNLCEIDSDHSIIKIEKKKLKKKSKNNEKSSETDIFFGEADTISDVAFNNPLAKIGNLSENGADCNTLKRKKKKLKNKFKNIEKSSESVIFSDETETVSDTTLFSNSSGTENNLIKNNSDSNSPKKKRKKNKNTEKSLDCHESFNEVEHPITSDISHELSLKKSKLHQNKAYQNLQAAKFRYLNEMLYTNSGNDALSYFQKNTDEYLDYHLGYQSQVSKWPINPVNVIIQEISKINKQAVIADLGCGEAKIAEVFPNRTVHSFDLIALKDCVTACDMSNVPLPTNSVDVVVFCLSLMGTNWKDYLKESQRILKFGGIMKIAEIESRIENLQHFIKEIENFGFSLINQNLSHKMFVFLNFKRANRNKKSSKIPAVILKPCLYKKR